MNLKTFESQISDTILKRGKSYYEDGAVADLQDMENGLWFAIVEGSDDYDVELTIGPKGEILDYSCTCPYDGEICKHTVAALYQIREEKAIAKPSKKTERDIWKNIIDIVPEEELREFVMEYAIENKELRNAILVRFSDYDKRDNREKYNQILKGIFSVSGDRHGFIDYYHSSDAMHQVSGLLARADDYLEKQNYKEAFYIASSVAPSCIKTLQNMDDSNGDCGGAINEAFETLSKIFQSGASASLKNEIFEWLLLEAKNEDYEDYGCAESLYSCIIDAINSPESTKRVLTFLDSQLKHSASQSGWSKEYNTKKFLGLKMEVLNKTGQEENATQIITDNLRIHDFRKIVVKKQLAESNFKEAILLIREGIEIAIADNYPGVVTDWKEMLLDIFRKQNNKLEWREIARELFYSGRYEMKYYHEYKDTFEKEEWNAELDKIIARFKNEKSGSYPFANVPLSLANIYIEEKMWSHLFGLLQNNVNIGTLLQYTPYLIKDYAPELIPIYKNAIERAAERTWDRSSYHQLANYIVKMSEISGGIEPARQLACQLMEKYNKRPAMKDELKKCLTL
jgi:hypothetical protein